MPRLDIEQVVRGLRALLLLGLVWEAVVTVRYPWHSEQQEDTYFTPAWRLNAVLGNSSNKSETLDLIHPHHYDDDWLPIYSSTKLLQRCQSVMQYNVSSLVYETGPLAVWSSVESVMASDPAAAWATWQELIWTARNPWAAHWACAIAPETWHIMPDRMRQNLELLEEAVPVLIPEPPPSALTGDQHSNRSSDGVGEIISARGADDGGHRDYSRDQTAAAAAVWWDTAAEAELAAAATLAAGNYTASSVEGSDRTSGLLSDSTAAAGNESNSSIDSAGSVDEDEDSEPYYVVRSRWIAHCTSAVNATSLKPVNIALCTITERANASNIGGSFHIQAGGERTAAVTVRRLFGIGPLAASLYDTVTRLHQFSPRVVQTAVAVGSLMWHGLIPFGNMRALVPLMRYLSVLELEFDWEVMLIYIIVLLAVFRSWLYLLCVAYKVSRRLGLLAFHNFWDRLTGTLLTFLGMFLGLWQNMGYAVLDLAIDVLLMKLAVSVLDSSVHAAFWAWSLSFEWGVFEMRAMVRSWKMAKAVWIDARNLVMNPQAMVIHHPVALAQAAKNKVNTIGPWPSPLQIPDEIDDLPNSDIPRGFICPITQSVMRQPALLLHDQTVTPSSYEKEAISEWLGSHSTDPKTPGRKLHMKSVKLVYNGDLARAIEDWASQTVQRTAAQHRQFSFVEQRLQQIRTRAQEALFQRQQQQPEQQRIGIQGFTEHGTDPFAAAAALTANGDEVEIPESPTEADLATPAAQGPAAATQVAVGAAAGRPDAGCFAPATFRGGGTASNLVRQSSAAIATVASLDIPSVATAGLAALADTTRRITTRAAARRLAQQQQQRPRASDSSSGDSMHECQESPLASPRAPGSSAAAAGELLEQAASGSPSPGPELGMGSAGPVNGRGTRKSLRVRRTTSASEMPNGQH